MHTRRIAILLVFSLASVAWRTASHASVAPSPPAGPVIRMPLPADFLPPGLANFAWEERLAALRPGMTRAQVERILGVCAREAPGPVGEGDVVKLVYPDPGRMELDAFGPMLWFGTRTTDVYIDLAGGGFQSYRRWFMHC